MHRYVRIATLCAALLLPACMTRPPPPIARDLSPKPDEARSQFDERIRQRFPTGSDEAGLLAELRKEGFKIWYRNDPADKYGSHAEYEGGRFPCDHHWSVSWTASAGKITDIASYYQTVCL